MRKRMLPNIVSVFLSRAASLASATSSSSEAPRVAAGSAGASSYSLFGFSVDSSVGGGAVSGCAGVVVGGGAVCGRSVVGGRFFGKR